MEKRSRKKDDREEDAERGDDGNKGSRKRR